MNYQIQNKNDVNSKTISEKSYTKMVIQNIVTFYYTSILICEGNTTNQPNNSNKRCAKLKKEEHEKSNYY